MKFRVFKRSRQDATGFYRDLDSLGDAINLADRHTGEGMQGEVWALTPGKEPVEVYRATPGIRTLNAWEETWY